MNRDDLKKTPSDDELRAFEREEIRSMQACYGHEIGRAHV